MRILSFFLGTLYLNLSCTSSKVHYYKYSINIQEIDCKAKKIVSTIKNSYISCDNGLFEYDYKIKNKVVVDRNSQITHKEDYDSLSISFIPESKVIYYQFDLSGNFIFTDSIKKKNTDFIKINPENKVDDPVYKILIKIKETDLSDTAFNGTSYKVYSQPHNFDDSIGEIGVQLLFIKSNTLKTPFNIAGRYPGIFNKFCFAGVLYHILNVDRKLVSVISDIKPVTKEQENLCRLIQNKLLKLIKN